MPASTSKVEIISIAPDQAGQRIDNFLMARLKGVPRGLVYRLLRSGQVRVNSGRKKPHYRLKAGDDVRIPPVERRETEPVRVPQALQQQLNQLEARVNRDLQQDPSLGVLLRFHYVSGPSHS